MVISLANGKDIIPERQEVEKKGKLVTEIFDNALLINGTFINYGKHAGGVVISDGNPVSSYVSLMRTYDKKIDKYIYCTQCDKDEIESFYGLLKMDLLGLNTLSIINDCIKMIAKTKQIYIDVDAIPFEKEVFDNIYSKGITNGVFQFESQGMKSVLKKAKPQDIDDLVILNAMYRPGPMDSIDDIIKVMNGEKPHYEIKELEPILKSTYGFIVYQEQVMKIFTDLAGYSLAGADNVRRAMSKKKTEVLKAEKKAFLDGDKDRNIKGCVANGIDRKKAEVLFNTIEKFSEYAFNKSHAVAYSILSYYTAYLKYHFPKEFIATSLNRVADEKKEGLIKDGKVLGVNINPPSINKSLKETSIVDGNITIGFKGVKTLSEKSIDNLLSVRETFDSFEDFLLTVLPSKKDLTAYISSGMLDEFRIKRSVLIDSLSELLEFVKKEKEINRTNPTSEKVINNLNEKRFKNREDLSLLIERLKGVPFSYDTKELSREKDLLGVILSVHPLNNKIKRIGTPINELPDIGDVTVTGIILDLKIRNKKSDNKEMAFFTLDDITGEISVSCFEYEQFKDLLEEIAPVTIDGYIKIRNGEKQLIVKSVKKAKAEDSKILIIPPFDNPTSKDFIASVIKDFESDEHLCFVYLHEVNKIAYTNTYVSKDLFNSDRLLSLGYKIIFFD